MLHMPRAAVSSFCSNKFFRHGGCRRGLRVIGSHGFASQSMQEALLLSWRGGSTFTVKVVYDMPFEACYLNNELCHVLLEANHCADCLNAAFVSILLCCLRL